MPAKAPILLLADLDDSCFQTEGKCPPGITLRTAAWDRSGRASSFQSPAQVALLDILFRSAMFVPVTGRNREALDRTVYREAPFAITSFGGEIHTPDGPDEIWGRRAGDDHYDALERLTSVTQHHIRSQQLPLRCSLVRDANRPQYVSLKADHGAAREFTSLIASIEDADALPSDWRRFRTARSLALAPPHLGKGGAVRHFLSTLVTRYECTIGLGDGHADAEFLSLCDFAMTPRGSSLHELLTASTAT